MSRVRERVFAVMSFALAGGLFGCGQAVADTIEWALAQAYQNNPSLNAQRAALRATDEKVPQALSGYRPTLSVSVNGAYNDYNSTSLNPAGGAVAVTQSAQSYLSHPLGATVTQSIFNGFQTANNTRQAESQVESARESLRVIEQQVLLDAATAYMNLLRDQAIVIVDRQSVVVLTQELRRARDRYVTGELSSTDMAQAATRLAAARSSLMAAESNYLTSKAVYRRVIGVDPGRLAPGVAVDRLLPGNLARAIKEGETHNPSVLAAAYGVDVAVLAVKISEGALYPSLTMTLNANQSQGPNAPLPGLAQYAAASAIGQLTVPVYQGGAEYAAIRQNKETLGSQRLALDVNVDQARATVTQAWSLLATARSQIEVTTGQVRAAESALNGVREEAFVGQRTTIDVLNAVQELVNARIALVTAQHDRVVASYTLLAATGQLSPPGLGLDIQVYDPTVHYQQVRDAWGGLRNPDGR